MEYDFKEYWANLKQYIEDVGMPVKDFHETFEQMVKWVPNFDTPYQKTYYFPIIYYLTLLICIMSTVRNILNIDSIIREYKKSTLDSDGNDPKPSFKTIFMVKMVCQIIHLITYWLLLAAMCTYHPNLMLPFINIQLLIFILEFPRHCWNFFKNRKPIDFQLLLGQICSIFFYIFLLSLRNHFVIMNLHQNEMIWF
ncbi:hypothetical protein DMENIID0001_146940 [Sergentomyia squamirostris]